MVSLFWALDAVLCITREKLRYPSDFLAPQLPNFLCLRPPFEQDNEGGGGSLICKYTCAYVHGTSWNMTQISRLPWLIVFVVVYSFAYKVKRLMWRTKEWRTQTRDREQIVCNKFFLLHIYAFLCNTMHKEAAKTWQGKVFLYCWYCFCRDVNCKIRSSGGGAGNGFLWKKFYLCIRPIQLIGNRPFGLLISIFSLLSLI